MRAVFADTSYFGAMLSPKDELHQAAVQWASHGDRPMVVTEFVLVELGNGLHLPGDRELFRDFMGELVADPNVTVVPASPELFRAGLDLYGRRLDKEWSLTDCMSFVCMREHGLREALTADHHFEQAGFKALLR